MTPYPGDSAGQDAGIAFRPSVFARGTSNELVCDELLFDFHRADFRPGSTPDFDVPDVDIHVAENEQTVQDDHQNQIAPPAAYDATGHITGGESPGDKPQAQSSEAQARKLASKPNTTKTGAATGVATKGGASKGKVGVAKKKR